MHGTLQAQTLPFLFALLTLTLLPSCSTTVEKPVKRPNAPVWEFISEQPAPSEPNLLSNVRWQVVKMVTDPIKPTHAPHIYFDLALQRANGNSGCNAFNGRFSTQADTLTVGSIMSTKMACDPLRSQYEYDFMRLLAATERYQISNRQLQLLDADGNTLLLLEPNYPHKVNGK